MSTNRHPAGATGVVIPPEYRITDSGVNYMIQASHAERASRVSEGHAGALDFVLGLTGCPGGWELLKRLEDEKPHLKGVVLWGASRHVGNTLAITQPENLTFVTIVERLLEES